MSVLFENASRWILSSVELSAFRYTKAHGSSFKQWNCSRPSLYWSYCSQRAVYFNNLFLFITWVLATVDKILCRFFRWFVVCLWVGCIFLLTLSVTHTGQHITQTENVWRVSVKNPNHVKFGQLRKNHRRRRVTARHFWRRKKSGWGGTTR